MAATRFDSDEPQWRLLGLLGGELHRAEVKLSARRHLLQLSAGMFDVFELRLQHVPHRLGWLCYDDISFETKADIVREFRSVNEDCLPAMCRRLRVLFPTADSLLYRAPLVIQAWMLSTFTAIDMSERAHASMRQDIASSGPASDFVQAANRSLCRQFVGEHLDRGGKDPARMSLGDIARSDFSDDGSERGRSGLGSSAFLEFHNVRAASYKIAHAPDRPMTKPEREEMAEKIREEWQRVRAHPGEYQLWRMRCQSKRAIGRLPIADGVMGADVCAAGEKITPFRGLWEANDDPEVLIPPADVADFAKTMPSASKPSAAKDDDFFVRDPPPRKENIRSGWGTLFGCQCQKKSCQHGLSDEEASAVTRLLGRLNKWSSEMASPPLASS